MSKVCQCCFCKAERLKNDAERKKGDEIYARLVRDNKIYEWKKALDKFEADGRFLGSLGEGFIPPPPKPEKRKWWRP
jgi:hypothetical protein